MSVDDQAMADQGFKHLFKYCIDIDHYVIGQLSDYPVSFSIQDRTKRVNFYCS